MHKASHRWFHLHAVVSFMENLLQSFMVFLTIFHELDLSKFKLQFIWFRQLEESRYLMTVYKNFNRFELL